MSDTVDAVLLVCVHACVRARVWRGVGVHEKNSATIDTSPATRMSLPMLLGPINCASHATPRHATPRSSALPSE